MTDRQSETNHLLVQIRDLLGDIALSIAGHPDRRPFRYSDTLGEWNLSRVAWRKSMMSIMRRNGFGG